MKILLRNGLVYCSALVLTGRACIETVQPKFQRENKPILPGIETKHNKLFQPNTHKTKQDPISTATEAKFLNNIISTTQQQVAETIKYLKHILAQLDLDNKKGTEQLNRAQTTCNTYGNKKTLQDKQDTLTDIIIDTSRKIQFAQEETIPKEEELKELKPIETCRLTPRKEIPNIRPTARREAIQPVKLVDK